MPAIDKRLESWLSIKHPFLKIIEMFGFFLEVMMCCQMYIDVGDLPGKHAQVSGFVFSVWNHPDSSRPVVDDVTWIFTDETGFFGLAKELNPSEIHFHRTSHVCNPSGRCHGKQDHEPYSGKKKISADHGCWAHPWAVVVKNNKFRSLVERRCA